MSLYGLRELPPDAALRHAVHVSVLAAAASVTVFVLLTQDERKDPISAGGQQVKHSLGLNRRVVGQVNCGNLSTQCTPVKGGGASTLPGK